MTEEELKKDLHVVLLASEIQCWAKFCLLDDKQCMEIARKWIEGDGNAHHFVTAEMAGKFAHSVVLRLKELKIISQ